jgi:hypothetical protein
MDIFFKAPDHYHPIILPKMGVEGSTRMVELSSCEMELKALVADTGTVHSVVAGFEIRVVNGKRFPWGVVFDYLASQHYEVWVTKEDVLVIKSKPLAV